MRFFTRCFLFLCLGVALLPLSAKEQSDVNQLLQSFDRQNGYSARTIDANRGHLFLFDRARLDRMHAKSLKDLFKLLPVIFYHENRWGLPDPLYGPNLTPYNSSFIRIYIDGVEVTQGWMGSGLVLYGDIGLDFADHVEFYFAPPSFDHSVEPAYLTIFIYSKDPTYDSGSTLRMGLGSYGYKSLSLSTGFEKRGVHYSYTLSHADDRREKIATFGSTLGRDTKRTQFFAHVASERAEGHLQLVDRRGESFMGMSWDATPLQSRMDFRNLHADFRYALSRAWQLKFAFDHLRTDLQQADEYPLMFIGQLFGNRFDGYTRNSTYTEELGYRKRFGTHLLSTGIKMRQKRLDKVIANGSPHHATFSRENSYALYLQDQYTLSEAQLLNLGAEYIRMQRNGTVADNNLLQLRLGYVYASNRWSYKAYFYRLMFSIDPFVRSFGTFPIESSKTQKTTAFTQELSYSGKQSFQRVMLLLTKDKNGFLSNDFKANTKYFFAIYDGNYRFDPETRLSWQLYYAGYKDIFGLPKLHDYSAYLAYEKDWSNFSFYGGLLWFQNSIDHENAFDLSATFNWDITPSWRLSLKGDNLLGKAKKTKMFRLDPVTQQLLSPVEVSPIDKRVILEAEYRF